MTSPLLSIVIPTREGLEEPWIAAILKVSGDVEVILVHPPGMAQLTLDDPRFKQINAGFRGEVMQRMTGFLNATGTYVLSLNCDEYVSPHIAALTAAYFSRFPDSWVMRLRTKSLVYGEKEKLQEPWPEVPDLLTMRVLNRANKQEKNFNDSQDLLELPIAPLNTHLDLMALFKGRKDQHGLHIENFDKKVWKNFLVQATIKDINQSMSFAGPFKYVPFWCLDRLLGLSLQAKFFEPDKIVGHWLPYPEQLRLEDNPPEHPRTDRFYIMAEILLLKNFPQHPYIWNLTLDHLRLLPKGLVKSFLQKRAKLKNKTITEDCELS